MFNNDSECQRIGYCSFLLQHPSNKMLLLQSFFATLSDFSDFLSLCDNMAKITKVTVEPTLEQDQVPSHTSTVVLLGGNRTRSETELKHLVQLLPGDTLASSLASQKASRSQTARNKTSKCPFNEEIKRWTNRNWFALLAGAYIASKEYQ